MINKYVQNDVYNVRVIKKKRLFLHNYHYNIFQTLHYKMK